MKKKMTIVILSLFALFLFYIGLHFVPALLAPRGYSSAEIKGLEIVGHRGGASLAPENSLACIEAGIQAGAPIIEIDIHESRDHQLIVCHDQTVDRTTNGSGRIENLTLAQIRKLRIKSKDGEIMPYGMPTLDEVMHLVAGRATLLIEIKRTGNIYPNIERLLCETIRKHEAREWTIVQSFNDGVLERIHQLDPGMRLEKLIVAKLIGLPLCFDGTLTSFTPEKYRHVESVNPWQYTVSQGFIDRVQAQGKRVRLWTAGRPEQTPRFSVNSIITNYPQAWK